MRISINVNDIVNSDIEATTLYRDNPIKVCVLEVSLMYINIKEQALTMIIPTRYVFISCPVDQPTHCYNIILQTS